MAGARTCGGRTWAIVAMLVAVSGCGSSPQSSRDAGPEVAEGGATRPAPDLRFKWVGSGLGLKYEGFSNGGTALTTADAWRGPIGVTPLMLTGEVSSSYTLFSAAGLEPMIVTATSGTLVEIDDDLPALVDSRAVVVGLDSSGPAKLPATDGVYNVTLSGSEGGVAYTPVTGAMVAAADLPAWAASRGATGSVITALCPKDGQLFVTAFGRAGDTSSYETQVVTATLAELVAKLEPLAAGGYVITALGRDGTGGFVAVGTRPAGQATPRTLKIVDQPCVVGGAVEGVPEQSFFDEGYALIGVVFHGTGCDGSPTWLFIGQR
jgi:hypothetical protein